MSNISLSGVFPLILLILFFISINTVLGHIFLSSSVINTISAGLLLIFVVLAAIFQPVYTGGQRGLNGYKIQRS